MKTILIAVDYSKLSDNATIYGLKAAQTIGAKVVLFHLHTLSVHASNARLAPSAIRETIDRNRLLLENKANDLSATYAVEVLSEWATGDFYTEIKRAIDTHEVDLVIMGMPGKSLEQDLLGNTTTLAINKLKFPVLAIPGQVEFNGIKKIVFACDIVRGVHAQILERVRKVALSFGAEVQIFHVDTKLKKIEDRTVHEGLSSNDHLSKDFGDGLSGINYSYKNVSSNAVIREIQREVIDSKADLLIMVPYKYGFWGSIVHTSKTRVMASGSDIPLLSIPI